MQAKLACFLNYTRTHKMKLHIKHSYNVNEAMCLTECFDITSIVKHIKREALNRYSYSMDFVAGDLTILFNGNMVSFFVDKHRDIGNVETGPKLHTETYNIGHVSQSVFVDFANGVDNMQCVVDGDNMLLITNDVLEAEWSCCGAPASITSIINDTKLALQRITSAQ